MAASRADPQHDKSLYAHVGTPATPSASLWECDEADEASGCFKPCPDDIMAQLTQNIVARSSFRPGSNRVLAQDISMTAASNPQPSFCRHLRLRDGKRDKTLELQKTHTKTHIAWACGKSEVWQSSSPGSRCEVPVSRRLTRQTPVNMRVIHVRTQEGPSLPHLRRATAEFATRRTAG